MGIERSTRIMRYCFITIQGSTTREIRAPRTPHWPTGRRGQGRVATRHLLPQARRRQRPNRPQARSECVFSVVRPGLGAWLRALLAAFRRDLRFRTSGVFPPWIWLPGFSGWNRRGSDPWKRLQCSWKAVELHFPRRTQKTAPPACCQVPGSAVADHRDANAAGARRRQEKVFLVCYPLVLLAALHNSPCRKHPTR